MFKLPIKKTLISLFALVNIFVILFINSPNFLIKAANETLNSYKAPDLAYKVRYFVWLVREYGRLTGLNVRWLMFGNQSKYNWRYKITANYNDSTVILLPLPNQIKRNFVEKIFLDFKEEKFGSNIYTDPVGREAYARFLCRQYPKHNNSSVESITYELSWQKILDPKEARLQNTHQDPNVSKMVLNVFKCPKG